jgi:hypothetical protein
MESPVLNEYRKVEDFYGTYKLKKWCNKISRIYTAVKKTFLKAEEFDQFLP